MQWQNTTKQYGFVTKFFHWAVFILFVNQYIVARIMVNVAQGDTALGFTQGNLYNWHKSVGLILLGLGLFRYIWRRTTRLPDWDATLSTTEQTVIHWLERIMYFCMIAMPLSGYFFVMAGGFGVNFFGQVELVNPIGQQEGLATLSEWTHIILGWAILISVGLHLLVAFRHAIVHKNGYLRRMLPLTNQ